MAEALRVNASLTSLDTRGNAIDGDGAAELAAGVLGSKSLLSFGKVPMKELRADELTELKLSSQGLGPTEGRVLGGLVAVSASLTEVLTFAPIHTTPPPRPPGVPTSTRP